MTPHKPLLCREAKDSGYFVVDSIDLGSPNVRPRVYPKQLAPKLPEQTTTNTISKAPPCKQSVNKGIGPPELVWNL